MFLCRTGRLQAAYLKRQSSFCRGHLSRWSGIILRLMLCVVTWTTLSAASTMIQQNSQPNEHSIHTRHIYTLHYTCALGTTLHTSIVVHNTVATTTSPLLSMHMHNKNSIHKIRSPSPTLFGGRECRALLRTLGCVFSVSGESVESIASDESFELFVPFGWELFIRACSPGSTPVCSLGSSGVSSVSAKISPWRRSPLS